MSELRIAVIEDDPRYRSSLEELFSFSSGFALGASFGSAEAGLDAAERQAKPGQPPPWDVILMDIDLPNMSGLDATAEFKRRYPALPIVVLTVFEDSEVVLAAIGAGADGYLLKRTEAPLILKQLNEVGHGGSPLTASVARKVLDMLREAEAAKRKLPAVEKMGLSGREQDVLRCLVDGCGYKEIAARLDVSLDTVRTHIRGIYKKLQVTSSGQAISKAIRRRLV